MNVNSKLCFQVWPDFSRALLDDKICKGRQFVNTVTVECLFPQPNWLAFKKKNETDEADETDETDETDEPQESSCFSDADLPVALCVEYGNQTY